MKKRILSALLALCMVFALGTVGAMAEEPTTPTTPTETDPATVYVNSGIDENASGQVNTDGKRVFRSLSGALEESNKSDSLITTIILETDINPDMKYVSNVTNDGSAAYTVTKSVAIKSAEGVKNISVTNSGSTSIDNIKASVFTISGSNVQVTIQDVNIDGNSISRHGVNVFGGPTVTLTNVTSNDNKGYGVCINGSTVIATNLTAQENDWGGVNVDSKDNESASFTMDGGDLTKNGGENSASVVIESTTGKTTSTTLKSGTFDRVYTHDNDTSNHATGDDEIIITGGTYSAVEIHQSGSDTVSITGATVTSVKNENSSADFGVKDSTVTTIYKTDGSQVTDLNDLSGVNINFNNVTVGSTEEDGTTTTVNNVVATIGNVQYRDLQAAIDAAGDTDRIELTQNVELTSGLTVSDSTYIDGNGFEVKITLGTEDAIGVKQTGNGTLTLDNVKLSIYGAQEKSIDGMNISGEVKVTGNSTVNISNLRSGILGANTDSKLTVDSGSSLTVYNVTGNGTQSVNWTVNGTVKFEKCGDYGMSVESLATGSSSSITVEDCGKGAIYAVKSINIGDGSNITINNCGNELPFSSQWGSCSAPIQIKVTDSGVENNASITIGAGATVTIQDCKNGKASPESINNIYVPEGVEYINNGTLNGSVVFPENTSNVIVSYVYNDKVIYVVSVAKGEYTIEGRGIDGVVWMHNTIAYTPGSKVDLSTVSDIFELTATTPVAQSFSISYTNNDGTYSTPTSATADTVVTIRPNSGYRITSVTISADNSTTVTPVAGADGSYTFTMPASNVTVTVATTATTTPPTPGGDDDDKPETPTTYTVTPSYNSYGTLRINGYSAGSAASVAPGTSVTVTVTPQTGYRVDSVTYRYNGANYSATQTGTYTFSFIMPAGNVTVSANIVPSNAYPLNISSVSHGSIKLYDEDDDRIYDEDLVPYGETVTIEVTPAEGYILKSITVEDSDRDDIEVEKVRENVYRFDMPRDEVTLYTEFTPGYEITIDDDIRYGEITTDPEDYAAEDDTVEVYFKPSNGYKLKTIEVFTGKDFDDEVTVRLHSSGDYYRFTMPDGDVYITAEFERTTMPFTDVRTTDWYYDEVLYVYNNGLMEGVSSYSFNPSGTMTREMFWAVLGRIDGQSITGTNWASQARSWAMNEGVSDGTNPTSLITREEMVTMLWRYAGSRAASGGLSRFNDASTISSWASTAMSWAVNNGIIDGVTSNTIQPRGTADRAQCAAIFMRYDQM